MPETSFNTARSFSSAHTAAGVQQAARLEWHADRAHGQIPTTTEATTTITVDGVPLLGIDLATGTVLTWPDGEHASTVARFPPTVIPPAADWPTRLGQLVVLRPDYLIAWPTLAGFQAAPVGADGVIAWDETMPAGQIGRDIPCTIARTLHDPQWPDTLAQADTIPLLPPRPVDGAPPAVLIRADLDAAIWELDGGICYAHVLDTGAVDWRHSGDLDDPEMFAGVDGAELLTSLREALGRIT